MFTGDLVQAAGSDSHEDAYDQFLDRVSKATGCSDERIFIVPGNHDLARSVVESSANDHRKWQSLLGANELEKLNELHEAGDFEAVGASKFSNFFELERYIGGEERPKTRKYRSAFAWVDHIDALNVDLVTINTAMLSTGGHPSFPPDEGRLAVPEYAIIEACKNLSPDSFRIFAAHHPTAMLSEQSARYLESQISKHANLFLYGHMHDPQPKNITGLNGEVLCSQAGGIFVARKEYYNGYSLITTDKSNGLSEIIIRSYYKDRDSFDDGIDIIKGGRWYKSQEDRQHFRKIAAPVDQDKFRKHLSGSALERLNYEEQSAGGEGDIHVRFVAPPLRRTFIQELSEDNSKVEMETPVSFDEIIGEDSNIILYARPEYGRTTLLRELRFRSLEKANEIRFPRIPALLDFATIGSTADAMLRSVRNHVELLPDGHDIESLLKLGHVTLMIDDVQFDDRGKIRALGEFVKRYPKARYILSSPQYSATHLGAHINPEMPVRFEFVEIKEFRRDDMRQLLARYEQCPNVEKWLDRIQDEFREINLPFTAANGSIFIEILAEKHNFSPINRSVLMEQFIDSTLRKAAVEQSRRETFDYTNKTDLLSHIAAWMTKQSSYMPQREQLREQIKKYVDDKGLVVVIDNLLNEFLIARIFIYRADGRISFRYRGVLEYFIALRMNLDPSFKNWVMEEDRYLTYVREILYYAGKNRNDPDLLATVRERHEGLMALARDEIGDVDLHSFDNLILPRDGDGAYEEIEDSLSRAPLSIEERDQERDQEITVDGEGRQEVFRSEIKKNSDKASMSLMLYSGLIKNMELISDAEKRANLAKIWDGWSTLLYASLQFAPKLAKERKVRINGALYEVQAPQGMSAKTLSKLMMLYLPHVHIKLISGALGTEKLEKQLVEPGLEEAEDPKVYSLLRVGLIADLRLDATPGAIEALAVSLKDNHYLLWSLIMHVSELRRLDRVKPAHFAKLDTPLAIAFANLRGGDAKSREREKRRQIARLARDRLLLKVKGAQSS